MNRLSLLLLLVEIVKSFTAVIAEGTCDQNPYEICTAVNRTGVLANSTNLKILTDLLTEKDVEKAYVYGWEDHKDLYVLYSNGTLVPYIKDRITSKYALCVGDCPCKPKILGADSNTSCCGKKDKPVVESCCGKKDKPVVESCCGKKDKPVVESCCGKKDKPVVESCCGKKDQIKIASPCCGKKDQIKIASPCCGKKDQIKIASPCCTSERTPSYVREPDKDCKSCCALSNQQNESNAYRRNRRQRRLRRRKRYQRRNESSSDESTNNSNNESSSLYYRCYPIPTIRFEEYAEEVPFSPAPVITSCLTAESKSFEIESINEDFFTLLAKEELNKVRKKEMVIAVNEGKLFDIPRKLYDPWFLYGLKRRISRDHRVKACLYISDDDQLFAMINGKLFLVDTTDNNIKLEIVHKEELGCLELHEIVFRM